MREDVQEELPPWHKRMRDLDHKTLVVLHMLEELDGEDTVVRGWFEVVVHDVAGYNGKVR